MSEKFKTYIKALLLILAIVITGFSFYKNEKVTVMLYEQEKEEVYGFYIRNFEIQMQSLEAKLPETVSLDDSPNIAKLLESGKPLLVLRIKETSCSSCIESAVEQLRQYEQINRENCVMLVSYSNLRTVSILLKKFDIDFYYLNLFLDDMVELPVEQYESPYLFTLHPNREIRNFFIPEKTYTEMTSEYLEAVVSIINPE